MTVELKYEFPVAVDNTMRTAWDSCQRKFLLGHIYNLRAGKPSVHLVFGGAYAKGLEVARREFYEKGNINKEDYLGKALLAIIKEWATELDDPLIGEQKSLTNCLCALLYFFETWPMATDWVAPLGHRDQKPAIEFSFAIPIEQVHPNGDPILYAGRFDMFADYATEPAVYDDKTTSQLGNQWVKGWSLDSQMTGYIWAGQEAGFKTTVAIIRGVSILKTSFGHAQAIEHRTKFEVESWRNLLSENIRTMLQKFDEGEDHFLPSYGYACKAYGGCPYITLCKQRNWKEWIEPDFHEFVWNPLDHLKV